MSDVKWIKITTDIFDDEKILLIESLPDSYAIITVWFKLLCLAGKQNNSGVFMLGKIAYTDKMLATIFRMKESTVTMALNTFAQFGMVELVDGVITIPNWGKHQNLEQLEERRNYQREYQREYRQKQKLLASAEEEERKHLRKHLRKHNVNSIEGEEDKEKEKDIDTEGKVGKPTPQQVVDLYHKICVSFPSVRTISESRKKAIKARLNTYTLEDFETLFKNAESSSFLKGSNPRNWSATFDWLIKDSNMAKVIEGNYTDKPKDNGTYEINDFFNAAVKKANSLTPREALEREVARNMENKGKPKTASDDPELARRMEELKSKIGGG